MPKNTKEETKMKLPLWAASMIGLVVTGIIAVYFFSVSSLFLAENIFKNAQNPKHIQAIASTIGEFASPLPEGFKYAFGSKIFDLNAVSVVCSKNDQLLVFLAFPSKDKNSTSKELLKKVIDSGIAAPTAQAKFCKTLETGTQEVGGQELAYIFGKLEDPDGKRFDGYVACVVNPQKSQTILVYGIQPPESKYDLATTKTFLSSIKKL